MTRNQGEGDEGLGRILMRIMVVAKACLRRTATSYYIVDLLAKGQ
jgi:hypothetical protein